MTLFGAGGRYRIETLEKGNVGHILQGYGHSLGNVGAKPCRILIGLNTPAAWAPRLGALTVAAF